MSRYPIILRIIFVLLLLILVLFSLIEAKDFLIPVFLAILFAYLLFPVSSRLEHIGIPRIAANLICIIVTFAIIIGGMIVVANQVANLLKDLPAIREQFNENISAVQLYIQEKFGISETIQTQWLERSSSSLFDFSVEYLQKLFNATTSTLVKFGLLPVYTFFFLYYRNKIRHFLLMIFPEKRHDQMAKTISDIANITPRYLSGLVIVVLILCVINSGGFLIIGVQQAIFLGVVAAIMNFIPYIGTILGYGIVLLFVLLAQGSLTVASGVLIQFFIVQFTENNILTPNITGSQVQINPLVTIMSIIVGGMIWGVAGMFIVIPFLAMFKILCDNMPELKPYGYLMGTRGTEKYAITWEGIKSKFKKWFK